MALPHFDHRSSTRWYHIFTDAAELRVHNTLGMRKTGVL
jgi:hypothetical protein